MNAAESVILELALAVPLARRFDYLPPAGCDLDRLQIGMRVSVPFGRQTKVGVLLAIKSHSEFSPEKLKPALAVMDQQPLLSQDDLQLLLWASQYYHHPVGEVLSAALPVLLRQGQPAA
ncbi:MAG: primosomal protein N', partial [Methylococcaceae bacterium]|nr:primosomal protein N' [Methylococcaceae bacterium]